MIIFFLKNIYVFLRNNLLNILGVLIIIFSLIINDDAIPYLTFILLFLSTLIISSSILFLILHKRYKKDPRYLKNKSEIIHKLSQIELNNLHSAVSAANQKISNDYIVSSFKELCYTYNTKFEHDINITFIFENLKEIFKKFIQNNPKKKFIIKKDFKILSNHFNSTKFFDKIYIEYKENTLLNFKTPVINIILNFTILVMYVQLFKDTIKLFDIWFVIVSLIILSFFYYIITFLHYIYYMEETYVDMSNFYLNSLIKIESNL